MRLTRTTSHAIRILVACAEANGALVKTAALAKQLDITPLNVFKIVNMLSHAGLVTPVRGRNGGVRLARAPESIRIGEVVRTIESPEVEVAGEGSGTGTSKGRKRPGLNAIFDDALVAFISVLDQHSIADMTRQRGPILDAGAPRSKPRSRTKAAVRSTPVVRG